ncbi:hypothetical protein RJ55_08707 [Drechmeria coniospora]|nr:hypothetical protein RJ55_08707 [Drechmeria coniospora]
MSISSEALHKLAREIETQAAAALQQIDVVRSQIAAKEREQRLVRLTLSELADLPNNAAAYQGVGRMFLSLPLPDLRQNLEQQTRDIEGGVEKLNQRLLYLETTYKNSREHIAQMLQKR